MPAIYNRSLTIPNVALKGFVDADKVLTSVRGFDRF